MAAHPIESQIVLLAGARASVPVARLPDLLETAQQYVSDHHEEYERRYERVAGPREVDYFCVDDDYWERVGTELGFHRRETDAVRRAHADQFTRDGRRSERESEFETTLEIRDVVAVAATC